MQTIKSILGDTWFITDKDARPDGGDRTFSLNENMSEMIDKSQQSEKWARRLRVIANAPLNDEKNSIYVPDRNYFNWYRTISLNEPDFIPDDYFSGASLIYPEDTRLHIKEAVGEPGAHYGPYYITARDAEGDFGVVGFSESLAEVPDILEKLKGNDLIPLPRFSALTSTIYDLSEGFKAETHAVENHGMDIWTVEYHTTITNDENKIVFIGDLCLEEIITFRQSADALRSMLEESAEHLQRFLPEANEWLEKFNTLDSFKPVDVNDLREKLKDLPENAFIKLTCADQNTELLISSKIVKEWKDLTGRSVVVPDSPTKSDIRKLGLESLRLLHRREYTLCAKDIGGFAIEESWAIALSMEKIFEVVSNKERFDKRFKKIQENYEDNTQMTFFGRKAILEMMQSGYETDVSYLVDKVIPIEVLIKRARPEPNSSNESSVMGMS